MIEVLKKTAEIFSLVEPWIVFATFIFQFFIFFKIKKQKRKRQKMIDNIFDNILIHAKAFTDPKKPNQKEGEIANKEGDNDKTREE